VRILLLAKVDPFQLPIPQGLSVEVTDYLRNLDIFLKDLWVRTGGGDDLIERADVNIAGLFKGHGHSMDDIERFHYGLGVPIINLGNDGDFYFRSDGSTNTRIYHKGSGSWTAFI